MKKLIAAIALAGFATSVVPGAFAQPAAPGKTIALAPLSTLGNETTGAASKKLTAELEAALAQTSGAKVVGAAAVGDAIKKAKKAQLRACDGEAGCLAEVGKLAGADEVVYGEVGGLGDVQVVYLELVDVATGKVARSTTLQLAAATPSAAGAAGTAGGDDTQGGARGAAVRLLAPDKFTGKLAVAVDVAGASIYVDGKRLGKSTAAGAPVAADLSVGTHALRVTHPEYHDYVRFVDVPFADKPTDVQVDLQQFPIVERDLQSKEGSARRLEYLRFVPGTRTPWYRRWYVIAAAGAIVAIGAGALFDATAKGPSADDSRTIDPPPK